MINITTTEPKAATNCWFYQQLVSKTIKISEFSSQNQYQSTLYSNMNVRKCHCHFQFEYATKQFHHV